MNIVHSCNRHICLPLVTDVTRTQRSPTIIIAKYFGIVWGTARPRITHSKLSDATYLIERLRKCRWINEFFFEDGRFFYSRSKFTKKYYSRTPLIRPPSESHWCGRIRGLVAREGFVYEQKPLSVTRNVVVWEGWSLVRVVVRQGFYCTTFWFLRFLVIIYNSYFRIIRVLKRAIIELPTSNRKKVIDSWLTGLVAKNDPFSIVWKVISRKPLDIHRWKFAKIF